MKKQDQKKVNEIVLDTLEKAVKEIKSNTNCKRLRTCQAYVYDTENYYILLSYNTIIACMDKETEDVFDALRFVYGYTPTSAQHISKFDALVCYGGYKHNYSNERFTWREI